MEATKWQVRTLTKSMLNSCIDVYIYLGAIMQKYIKKPVTSIYKCKYIYVLFQ